MERRKPSAVCQRLKFGCLQARHTGKHNKKNWANGRSVWREAKLALTRKPERGKARLICVGRIHYPGIVDVSGCFNLRPAIVIESSLNGSREYTRGTDLCNRPHTCAIQREPVMRPRSGV